jgi:hypothetical protein
VALAIFARTFHDLLAPTHPEFLFVSLARLVRGFLEGFGFPGAVLDNPDALAGQVSRKGDVAADEFGGWRQQSAVRLPLTKTHTRDNWLAPD